MFRDLDNYPVTGRNHIPVQSLSDLHITFFSDWTVSKMNLLHLLSKNDYLLYISQYIGLETLTYITTISKEIQEILNASETNDTTLSVAIKSMVSPEVYYHAIQRVNELLELREGFYDHINDSYDKHHSVR